MPRRPRNGPECPHRGGHHPLTYEDLVSCGSFARARELGKLRTEGKEYVVQDGDVMEFTTFL